MYCHRGSSSRFRQIGFQRSVNSTDADDDCCQCHISRSRVVGVSGLVAGRGRQLALKNVVAHAANAALYCAERGEPVSVPRALAPNRGQRQPVESHRASILTFEHIPKTAGSTMHGIFWRLFRPGQIFMSCTPGRHRENWDRLDSRLSEQRRPVQAHAATVAWTVAKPVTMAISKATTVAHRHVNWKAVETISSKRPKSAMTVIPPLGMDAMRFVSLNSVVMASLTTMVPNNAMMVIPIQMMAVK